MRGPRNGAGCSLTLGRFEMNPAQRKFLLVVIAVAAMGFHLWHYRWGFAIQQPYDPPFNVPALTLLSIPCEPEIDGHGFENWGSPGERRAREELKKSHIMWYRESLWKTDWADGMWREYQLEPRSLSWLDWLQTQPTAEINFGVWKTRDRDDHEIWGIFVPLGILSLGVYLLLGSRGVTKRSD